MKEEKMLSEFEQLQAEEIMNELNECREDERASRNQIFTILTAIATFLTVIITVISMKAGGSSDEHGFSKSQLQLAANALSTVLLCTAMPWLANLGLLSTFRHFYIMELEKKLSELLDDKEHKFLHWETVSTPLVTFNYKHILPGYPMLYSINIAITFVSILVLAIVYILFIQLFAESFNLINILLTVIFWIVFFIVIFTIFVASAKSRAIYEKVREQAVARLKNTAGEAAGGETEEKLSDIRNFILYFIYPRIADVQKNVFIFLGALLGYAVLGCFQNLTWKGELVEQFVFCWFVLDFLIYQARYLWNDIRGASADQAHPQKGKRGRLPNTPFGERVSMTFALCVIVFRVLAAAVLIYLYGGALKVKLVISILLLILVSILYEYAKDKENTAFIFLLVSIGYPIRLFVGFIGIFPDVFEKMNGPLRFQMILPLVLAATAVFGTVFVTLTWVLEAIFLKQNQAEIRKKHYNVLLDQVREEQRGKAYPLAYKEHVRTIWNCGQICSSLLLMSAMCCVWMSNRDEHIFLTVLFGVLSMIAAMILRWQEKGKMMFLRYICLIVITGSEYLFQLSIGTAGEYMVLYAVLCLFRIGYASTYVMFCTSNYKELTSFGEELKTGIIKGAGLLLQLGIGENAYKTLTRKKDEENKQDENGNIMMR